MLIYYKTFTESVCSACDPMKVAVFCNHELIL